VGPFLGGVSQTCPLQAGEHGGNTENHGGRILICLVPRIFDTLKSPWLDK